MSKTLRSNLYWRTLYKSLKFMSILDGIKISLFGRKVLGQMFERMTPLILKLPLKNSVPSFPVLSLSFYCVEFMYKWYVKYVFERFKDEEVPISSSINPF